MNILIIGGSRFIGCHLTKRLLEDGHQVTLFNRGRTSDDFGGNIHRIHGDRSNHQDFYEQLSGKRFDVVVDMIAFKAEDSQSAVETFSNRVEHFIHVSTAYVYVVTRDWPCPLKESDFDRPLSIKTAKIEGIWDYSCNKRQCEEVLLDAHANSGFPVTILRPPIVLGERDYTLRAYSYFLRIQDGGPLLMPDGGRNAFTHIYQGDIVRTIASNLKNPVSFGKAYNLAQEEILTLRSFVRQASAIMGKMVELVNIPSDLLQRTSLRTSSSPLFHRRPLVLDVHRAVEDLNYTSTPVEIWLKKTVFWFMNEYQGGPPDNYRNRSQEIELGKKFKTAMDSMI